MKMLRTLKIYRKKQKAGDRGKIDIDFPLEYVGKQVTIEIKDIDHVVKYCKSCSQEIDIAQGIFDKLNRLITGNGNISLTAYQKLREEYKVEP